MTAAPRSIHQVAAEAGHAPMLARLSLRVTDEFRDRVDQAASDCELPPADWLREVIAGALDVHEERERLRQAEYAPDPPGQPEYAQELDAELATRTAETVPPEEPPLPTDADYEERVEAFAPFTVDEALMATAAPDAVFLHCLPAHRGEEVTGGVIDGPQSLVWDEAENRIHIQKSILAWCFGALG